MVGELVSDEVVDSTTLVIENCGNCPLLNRQYGKAYFCDIASAVLSHSKLPPFANRHNIPVNCPNGNYDRAN